MKLKRFFILFISIFAFQNAHSQAVMSKWIFNVNGKKGSYYANTNFGSGAPVYVFTTSPDSADILKVCYNTTDTYVSSDGLTNYMGQYLNPGYCYAQNYIHRFPRTPTVPTTKTISPKTGAIGLLVNGIPIYGLGDSKSYTGTTNATPPTGKGIWNVEVYKSEGFTLDTAFAAHPQQQSAYHTHATPYRLYKNTATTTHSPLIGFAFDGNPVYGPYGYSTAMSATSAVTRMKTGYSLRNITVRTTLPYGVTPTQTGPPVNATYPIGTYCEDYEWLASNGGHLDKYNGRTCVTPEYPGGTYAYFVTISAAGVPEFPYIIGIEYYGAPEITNFTSGGSTSNSVTIPSTGVTCVYASNSAYLLPLELLHFEAKITKTTTEIDWSTGSESNIKHFEIQRSKDALSFETIGIQRSQGNGTTTQNYVFYDEKPLPLAYYRLKIVENDGVEQFSKIVYMARKGIKSIAIYPSMVHDIVTIKSEENLENCQVTIVDMVGKVMFKTAISLDKETSHTVDLSFLPQGMYSFFIENEQIKQVNKIYKNE